MKKRLVVLATAALMSACGGSDPAAPENATAAAAAETESLPSRGDVWEVDPESATDAQVLAYLYGLHAFVRQGDDLYTATTRLTEVREDGEILVASLGGGLEARVESKDDKAVLSFSSGSVATLREHADQDPGERQ
jgi:hypothetical protein